RRSPPPDRAETGSGTTGWPPRPPSPSSPTRSPPRSPPAGHLAPAARSPPGTRSANRRASSPPAETTRTRSDSESSAASGASRPSRAASSRLLLSLFAHLLADLGPPLGDSHQDLLILRCRAKFPPGLDRASLRARVLQIHLLAPQVRPAVLQPEDARHRVRRVMLHRRHDHRHPVVLQDPVLRVAVAQRPLVKPVRHLRIRRRFPFF